MSRMCCRQRQHQHQHLRLQYVEALFLPSPGLLDYQDHIRLVESCHGPHRSGRHLFHISKRELLGVWVTLGGNNRGPRVKSQKPVSIGWFEK